MRARAREMADAGASAELAAADPVEAAVLRAAVRAATMASKCASGSNGATLGVGAVAAAVGMTGDGMTAGCCLRSRSVDLFRRRRSPLGADGPWPFSAPAAASAEPSSTT
jgi:hypothetical protein